MSEPANLLEQVRRSVAQDPADALRLTEALPEADAGTASVDLALLHQLRARALRLLGRHEEALAAFARAARHAERVGDPTLAAQVRIGEVDSLGMLGRTDDARALAERLAAILDAHGAAFDAAKVRANLGSLLLRSDRYEEALACYVDAEAGFRDAGDTLLQANLAINQAIALTYLDRTDEAIQRYEATRAVYQESGHTFEAAVVDTNLGFLHHAAGRYAAALARLTAAYPVFTAAERPHEAARCDLDTGDTYRALNLLPEALLCYERARTVFDALPLDDDQARARLGVAAVRTLQGDHAAARAALDSVIAYFESRANPIQVAHARLWRAAAAQRAGGSGAAEDAAAARATFAERGLDGWAAEAHLLEIAAQPEMPEAMRAEALDTIVAVARRTARGWLECRAEHARGTALAAAGARSDALERLRGSVAALESARTQIAPEDLHIAFLADKEAVYESLAALLLSDGPTAAETAEALDVVERSRSRLLLERLLSAATERPISEGLERLRADLNRAYRDALSLDATEPRRHGGAHFYEDRLAATEAAYARALRDARLAHTLSETVLQSPPTLERLQERLGGDETLLIYSRLGDRLAAFVLHRDRIAALPAIAPWSAVRHAARRLRYHLQKMEVAPALRASLDPTLRGEIDAVLERLYALIVAPVAGLLTGERVTVVPCDVLHTIPFHALRDGETYLLDRHELVCAPSAAVWHTLSSRPDRPRTDACALLVGVAGPGTENVRGEIDAAARQLPGATLLVGEDATLPAVRRHGPRHAIWHVATHALFRADNPLFSGLQLHDGWLLARDLYGMCLDADLVTLSACETGAVRVEPGDEAMGLTRGFLAAGARRVAASLWPADDAATAALMAMFYTHWHAGRSAAGALREAQRAVRAMRPHPYHWAAFSVFGSR